MRRFHYHLRSRFGLASFARLWLLVEGESEFWIRIQSDSSTWISDGGLGLFDPTPAALTAERAPRVYAWTEVMEDLSGLEPGDDWCSADQLPDSIRGLLGEVGSYNTPKDRHGDYRGGTIGASPAYSFTAHVAEVEVDSPMAQKETFAPILYIIEYDTFDQAIALINFPDELPEGLAGLVRAVV